MILCTTFWKGFAILIYQYFNAKYFTIDILNYSTQHFAYGVYERSNRSVEITLDNIKDEHFKMTSSEMYAFARFLPLLIGDLVPERNENWKLFLILLSIIDIVFQSTLNENQLNVL